jgi:hypothetical protein
VLDQAVRPPGGQSVNGEMILGGRSGGENKRKLICWGLMDGMKKGAVYLVGRKQC